MAQLDQFDLRVERATRTGGAGINFSASETMFDLSRMAGSFAARMGAIANKRAQREGVLAGQKAATSVEMPNINYTIDGGDKNPLGLIASAGHSPDIKNIRQQVLTRFKTLQKQFGSQLPINSGFRDLSKNDKAGGAKKSQHLHGNAVDINVSELSIDERKRLISIASSQFPGIGVYENSLHLDIASRRAWGPDHQKESVPEWARDTIATHMSNGFASDHTMVPPSGLQANITGHMGALTRQEPGTLYGDAYNSAAIRVYNNRLQTSASQQLEALSIANEGNPKALNDAIDAWAAGQLEAMPEEAKPQFAGLVARRKMVAMREASRTQARKLAAVHQAEIESNLAVRETDLFRMAQSAGMDEEADKAIGAELEDYERAIDLAGLSPVMAGRAKRKIRDSVVEARVLGHFNNLATASARQEYAASFQEEWKTGKGITTNVSADSYNKIAAGFSRRIKSDEVAANTHSRQIAQSVDDLMKRVKAGFSVPMEELASVQAQVTNSGNEQLDQTWKFFTQMNDWASVNRQARPDQVQAQIDGLRTSMAEKGATERGIEALGVMTGLLKDIETGLKNDPLAWAEQTGLAQVPGLDVSSAENMITSLQKRAIDAQVIGEHYNQSPRYFKKPELIAIKNRLAANPQLLARFAKSIHAGLGNQAPQALAEISTDAPLLAHVAGLVNSNGRDDLLDEVGHALTLRSVEGFKSALPKRGKLNAAANAEIGMALSRLPKTQIVTIEMAGALLESRMSERGLNGDDFGTGTNEMSGEYARAINDALGAKIVDGEQLGGLGTINGLKTLLPVEMSEDMAASVMENITETDLQNMDKIISGNAVPIRANQIRNAKLVAIAPGQYRVALGDPASMLPRWVMGERDFWVLDLNKIKAAQDRRPGPIKSQETLDRFNPTRPDFNFQLGG